MIGEALRLIRVFHDMKQKQVAEQVGLSTSYVSDIEHGVRSPTVQTIERYARLFDMPVSSILFFSENLDHPAPVDRAREFVAGKVLALMRFLEAKAEPARAD
jgi:transcriptional regulator with XRE-family HTH domain